MNYNILNIGAGKLNSLEELKPLLEQYIDNSKYFLVNLDKNYFSGLSPLEVEVYYKHHKFNSNCIINCTCDIFEFLERIQIKFNLIFIYRFFEHINREKLLYFIYLLSTVTKHDSLIEILSPDYKLLSKMIINEDPVKDPDFGKKDEIVSTEMFNELSDPHRNITTPDRIRRLFQYENRFCVTSTVSPYSFDGRDIYFIAKIRRI